MMNRSRFSLLAIGSLIAATTAPLKAATKYDTLTTSGQPLKNAFNRDAAKTRVMMLVSPT